MFSLFPKIFLSFPMLFLTGVNYYKPRPQNQSVNFKESVEAVSKK